MSTIWKIHKITQNPVESIKLHKRVVIRPSSISLFGLLVLLILVFSKKTQLPFHRTSSASLRLICPFILSSWLNFRYVWQVSCGRPASLSPFRYVSGTFGVGLRLDTGGRIIDPTVVLLILQEFDNFLLVFKTCFLFYYVFLYLFFFFFLWKILTKMKLSKFKMISRSRGFI